jgi:hypothetical protein
MGDIGVQRVRPRRCGLLDRGDSKEPPCRGCCRSRRVSAVFDLADNDCEIARPSAQTRFLAARPNSDLDFARVSNSVHSSVSLTVIVGGNSPYHSV